MRRAILRSCSYGMTGDNGCAELSWALPSGKIGGWKSISVSSEKPTVVSPSSYFCASQKRDHCGRVICEEILRFSNNAGAKQLEILLAKILGRADYVIYVKQGIAQHSGWRRRLLSLLSSWPRDSSILSTSAQLTKNTSDIFADGLCALQSPHRGFLCDHQHVFNVRS